jgi:Zn-dependent M28 family amino/carboxypeptidase
VEIGLRDALRKDVEKLAGEIGERNIARYQALSAAANYLEASLAQSGYDARRQGYELAGFTCDNIEVEIQGTERGDEIVIIGAHYDSVEGSPGANDNATGTAAVLGLARLFAGERTSRTVRFVEFVNEEPPYFRSSRMGSAVYARHCRKRSENIVAMLSLETIGYYSDEKGSQVYPFPFGLIYPSTGDFIGFVGNTRSRSLVRDVVASFRRHTKHPSEGGALPTFVPGIDLSDQWAFWREGYPGVMVTDTAPFRYPYYHTRQDTPDKVHYDRLARVVAGLGRVVADLAG